MTKRESCSHVEIIRILVIKAADAAIPLTVLQELYHSIPLCVVHPDSGRAYGSCRELSLNMSARKEGLINAHSHITKGEKKSENRVLEEFS